MYEYTYTYMYIQIYVYECKIYIPSLIASISAADCNLSTYTLIFCVHHLCLKGWAYVFYVGHINEVMNFFAILSKHHHHI
jgi:hypothetical protein